ncbi:Hypothetical_protein [Hexamita inflata]|uniref:Hypothetical_protein n=1 Tax=Hexamita inflata TaxID=28002 RepID=A0AA86V6X2_9EUKA|nr:Hypothetical protein HINF_LOCUS66466 [Hexamita inflata]
MVDQTEEIGSIPINKRWNTRYQYIPRKILRQRSQMPHNHEIQVNMSTQTQPPQATHNTDNTQTNQGAIRIPKQVVVNNFNCNNTSFSGQSKSQSTNKSEVTRKSQSTTFQTNCPEASFQIRTPVQKPKEAPQAPLPQETKKTQSQIPLVKSKHTSEYSVAQNLSQRVQYNY